MSESQNAAIIQKTRSAFIWSHVLNTPFWAIFNMLPFILYKDLHATPLQIMAIIILKPAVSLFAPYWSALIEKRRDRLLPNLIWARVAGHLPFFFFPFFTNVWFFIFSFGFYMLMTRGVIPAWMELLKVNIPEMQREKVFAYGSALSYLGAAVVPFALGGMMDTVPGSWRWIFPATALISLSAIYLKSRVTFAPEANSSAPSAPEVKNTLSVGGWIVRPWVNAWNLLMRRPDFLRFQLGFMLGGAGLIIMQPALPVFFMDRLQLNYTELAVALTLCKGVGFAATSHTWARLMGRIDIYRFNCWVTFLAFLFPLCLLAAQIDLAWLYAGYVLYGVMQGGSEMSWNLSGPLFAKEEESSVYSSVNVLTVGLRGCFVPALGTLLALVIHASGVMLVGGFLCLTSAYFMRRYSLAYRDQIAKVNLG